MKKDEAIKELAVIEKKAERLRKIIETPSAKKSIMDKIKSFEDACKHLKIKATEVLPKGLEKHVIAYIKLTIIAKALNEGWEPNWNDSSEYKYYPWFKADDSMGFVFVFTCYDWKVTYAHIGARLCFKTRGLAEYVRKQFESTYKDYLMID